MRLFVCLILSAIATSVLGQQPEQPIKTTICEINKDPLSFNKKLVEVSGYATHGFENSGFVDPSCPRSNDLPGIWMEYGGTAGTNTMYCCGVTPSEKKPPLIVQGVAVPLVRDELFERFNKLLHSKGGKDTSVQATVRAHIFARKVSLGSNIHYVGGYGHMGCCMLLAIEQVLAIQSTSSVPSIERATPDAKKGR